MADWIGETFTSSVGWTHLENLCNIGNRRAGTDGEKAGAQLTADAFENIGLRDVEIDEFPIVGWVPISTEISHELESYTGPSHHCVALPRGPSKSVTGDLIDIGYGTPEDFETHDVADKVVMVTNDVPSHHRPVRRREKYALAVHHGAAAFISRSNVNGCLPKTGGVGEKVTDWDNRRKDPIGSIPAITVSKEAGMRLSRRCAGDPVTVSVEADIDYDSTTSQNVHGVWGPETADEILVTAHHDAHDVAEGATDNGAGVAMVLEIANALTKIEDQLETKVHFISFGTEELGFSGSEYEASKADLTSIKAMVNIDSPVRFRKLKFYTPFEELESTITDVYTNHRHPIGLEPIPYPIADQWPFVKRGVPAMLVGCIPDSTGKQKFNDPEYHTAADTFDKLDPRNLREQAILLTYLVLDIGKADSKYSHKDPAEIEQAIINTGWAEQDLRTINNWPFDD